MVMDAGFNNAGRDAGGWDPAGSDRTGGDTSSPAGGPTDRLDATTLARDWITLWQSELSAMAADPELRESWQTIAALWAGALAAGLGDAPRAGGHGRHEHAGGQPGPADAPRAAAAAAAPDARDAEIERLAQHVAALERRMAEFERGGGAVDPKRDTKRKPRK